MSESTVDRLESSLATPSALLGVCGTILLPLGPLAVHLHLAAPMGGFLIFLAGALLGLIALPLSVVGLIRIRIHRHAFGHTRSWIGLTLGVLAIVVLVVSMLPAGGAPPINDISTDLQNPPAFVAATQAPANRGRDMRYPGGVFAEAQTKAYADLAPLELALTVPLALSKAEAVAKQLGWTVIAIDSAAGILEAQEASKLFQFVDDIVIRIQATATGGAVIDMRSKSRDGKGDMGANAKRIRRFFEAIQTS